MEGLPKESRRVFLPTDLLERIGPVREATIAFGASEATVSLDESPGGAIILPEALLRKLCVATDLSYRVRVERGRIRLGPVIGILAASSREGMRATERVRALSNHLVVEPERGGLFFLFDAESVDLERGVVQGVRCLPDEVWEEGEFPIPQVIFRRYGAKLGSKADRLKRMGVRIFNERTFHKGDAARWLDRDERLQPHLPETVSLKSVKSVLAMLARHEAVYIKPVWGSQAAGILRVRREPEGFELAPAGQDATYHATEQDLAAALKPLLPKAGIVQQGITLAKVGGRMMDFRVVMQRDGRGDWGVRGIVARCGVSDRPVTNISAGGFPLHVDEALSLLFGRLPTEVFRRRQDMVRLALGIGEALDETGLLLGDLGVDVAYDNRGHLWLIEVNNRDPNHTIGLDVDDWPGFLMYRSMPLAFACFLAGFGHPQGGV